MFKVLQAEINGRVFNVVNNTLPTDDVYQIKNFVFQNCILSPGTTLIVNNNKSVIEKIDYYINDSNIIKLNITCASMVSGKHSFNIDLESGSEKKISGIGKAHLYTYTNQAISSGNKVLLYDPDTKKEINTHYNDALVSLITDTSMLLFSNKIELKMHLAENMLFIVPRTFEQYVAKYASSVLQECSSQSFQNDFGRIMKSYLSYKCQ